jgi:hypothetical protein
MQMVSNHRGLKMTKEDTKITIASATGKNVYIQAYITRTLARKVEALLEENNAHMVTPYNNKKKEPEQYA